MPQEGLSREELIAVNAFRSYFELPLMGIAVTSPQKGWIKVNDQISAILGYSREEILSMTWAEMTYPDDLAADVAQFERLLAGQIEQYRMEKRFVRKDGTVVWTELAVGCVRGLGQKVEYTVALVNDISERKKVEDVLRSKTALLEAQLAASIDGILVVDAQQKRTLVNQRMFELFNVPEAVRVDEDDASLLNYVVSLVKYPDKFVARVRHLFEHRDETGRDEIEFSNGMFLDRYSAPVVGKDGTYHGRIWMFRDITERKAAEEKERLQKNELEVFYRASVGREERIMELKEELAKLKKKAG
ncbi:MAG: PAS domain S-box protein [Candidatus Omnitrophota bacterium]